MVGNEHAFDKFDLFDAELVDAVLDKLFINELLLLLLLLLLASIDDCCNLNKFDAESSLRGGNRSFTLSSVLASSNEIFFLSPSVSLPRTTFAKIST